MRGLADLMVDAPGRAILRAHGIFTDAAQFKTVATPRNIFVHQQPCADFAPSVIAKFELLRDLAFPRGGLSTCFVAIDTDRAASSKQAIRLSWRAADGRHHVLKLTPPGTKAMEFRNIHLDPDALSKLPAIVSSWAHSSAARGWETRLKAITPLLVPRLKCSYADYAAELGLFLLKGVLGEAPAVERVSTLQDHPAVRAGVKDLLRARTSFIAAFNRSIAGFKAQGIDPAVQPLAEDYLPFFYSCPVDGERIRLRLARCSGEATGQSRAGRCYRFPATPERCVDELFGTGRASLDVLLPVFMTPLFDGLVAGRSSALYCMIMQAAMSASLGQRLMPIVVPASLAGPPADPRGLFQRWLEGDGQ